MSDDGMGDDEIGAGGGPGVRRRRGWQRRRLLQASAVAPALPWLAGWATAGWAAGNAAAEDAAPALPDDGPEAALARVDWLGRPGALRVETFGGGPGKSAVDNGAAFAALFTELAKRKGGDAAASVYIAPGTYDLDRSFSPSGQEPGFGADASRALIVFDNVVLRVPDGAEAGAYMECFSHAERRPGVRRSLSEFRMRPRESYGAESAAAVVDRDGRGVVKHCLLNLRNTEHSTWYGRLTLAGPARQVANLVALGNTEAGEKLNAGNTLFPHLTIRGFEIGIYGTPLLDAPQDSFPDLLKASFLPQLYIEDVERAFVVSHNKTDMTNVATAAIRQRLTSYLFATQLNIGTAFINAMKPSSGVDMIELNEATLNIGQLYCHTPVKREGDYARYWLLVGNDSTLVCGSLRVDVNTQISGGAVVFVGPTPVNAVPCTRALVDVVSFNRNSRAKTLTSVVAIDAEPDPARRGDGRGGAARRRQVLIRASDGAAELPPVAVLGRASTEDTVVLMTADTWGRFAIVDGRLAAQRGC